MTHYVAYSRARFIVSWLDNKRYTNVAEFSVTYRTCRTHGVGQECIEDFDEENRRKKQLERLSSRRDNNRQMDAE